MNTHFFRLHPTFTEALILSFCWLAPSSAFAELGARWGKIFPGDGTSHNLVLQQGKLSVASFC